MKINAFSCILEQLNQMMELTSGLKNIVKQDFDATREHIEAKIYNDSDIASKAVSDHIIEKINQKTKRGEAFVMGLATGSTPIKVYRNLIQAYKNGTVSFKNVYTFNLDEYFPMDSSSIHSYVQFMHQNLFDEIDIPKTQIHIPDGTLPVEKMDAYCADYEEKIATLGGIDLQLLGIGRTGHIGFNEPDSSFESKTRLVWLDPLTRKDASSGFFGEKNVPTQAITMGMKTIMQSKEILLLAWGESKVSIIKKVVEGSVTTQIPATLLQKHSNCKFILDKAAASKLTREKTPWLVGPCVWDTKLIRKAIIWLSHKTNKSILKLTKNDFMQNHLAELFYDPHFDLKQIITQVYESLYSAFDLWQSNTVNTKNAKAVVFSPHPDDDVISMGGTLIQLVDNGFDVHVAYQTSGNIAVHDDDVLRFLQFCIDANPDDKAVKAEFTQTKAFFKNKKEGQPDLKKIQDLKAFIRKGEALAACRVCGVDEEKGHFMNLPFYETGAVKKNPHTQADIDLTYTLLDKIKPEKIFAAGDLSDPHGTHRVCLQILFDTLDQLIKDKKAWVNNCEIWLYRGAWQEWEVSDIEMAVPLSPADLIKKRRAIFKHQSQKDKAMFPGPDEREFWQRSEQRNRKTAKEYNLLGLPEYEAVEGFVRYYP